MGLVISRTSTMRTGMSALTAKIRLNTAADLDRQRIAVTILRGARSYSYPAFTDAILLDVVFLDSLETNADVAREHFRIIVRTSRVGGETVGKLIVRRLAFLAHSRPSISLARFSGFVVGAWRATTLPERSIRNFVKFHLIDEPSSPDFSFFRCL